jgi:phosphoribosyl 1,2-cyclic phosphodiesterase
MEMHTLASGSSGNAYLVTDGTTELLIEAGLTFRQIREGLDFGLSRIAGCLISHDHGDHAKAVKDLLKAGVDCYMSIGTAEALDLPVSHRLHIIRAREQFTLGTWTVLPFEAVHDAAEPLSFLLASQGEKLLFATDTAYIRYRFAGLTHLMVECNYDLDVLKTNVIAGVVDHELKRRTLRSHMSLETLKGFLKANDLKAVRQIWLLHLSGDNSDAERFKTEVQRLTGKPVTCCEARGEVIA